MRNITPEEIKLATLKYNDGSQGNTKGFYVYTEFIEPIRLDGDKPIQGICTLVHSTPEFAYQNFENLFQNPSEAKKVKKRTLIDACEFIF